MKITLCLLALLGAASAAPNPISNPDPSPLLQKRCTAGTNLHSWCVSACGYNCRVQYGSCRNAPPPNCSEAYSRMVSYCTTCCNTGDCTSCQNCGNYYPLPMPTD
ncbi:hypothetical protein TWF225_003084 [Orbilia oligospora]|uniref:Uncharacterized protein n=1 Tax=Orbilia oligospora TaxID=2813651 RepID=A0A8H2DYY2_ORBOL|nr:hypothetical protein TWF225_003084 [Orbilia oligospora]KAF3244556.1 hypothetical protein TWF128_009665 [Orbilia oligospora]KAF3264922.1 hypothetical protein TWF217_003075 [Orbilia oligospora]KAF3294564.1 hypothetical protein TWF132_003066 [Orbilia oligospora]TGJ66429.1 hypothetical protein EYR41_008060 [Orbilia oligospora]